MKYAELHCRTNFSFLAGASHPVELLERASELELVALAITDLAGFYGVVHAWEARKRLPDAPPLIYGSELPLKVACAEGDGDPDADALVLLARSREGYSKISQLITRGRLRAQKGEFSLWTSDVLQQSGADLVVLCGGPRSRLMRRVRAGEQRAARAELQTLKEAFGDALYLELTRHLRPGDKQRAQALHALGERVGVPAVATNDVFFHRRARKPLYDVLSCIRERVSLTDAGRRLLPNAERALKAASEMGALFHEMPDVVGRTVEVAERCRFDLATLGYSYPQEAVPPGEDADGFLARLAREGLARRVGVQRAQELSGQLQKELAIIAQLGYAGYFLTMWEVVEYCRQQRILCQGRGSAANSLVCYATGVTSVSPDQIHMLFERFLSVERAEPPDIDLDIEHDRREEVIQYVYKKYGRQRAAMVAEVIRYRTRSAVRDVGKALGLPEQTVLRISRFCSYGWDAEPRQAALAAGLDPAGQTWKQLTSLAEQLQDFPRHLSIHVGGFVLSSAPIAHVVPVENARMPNRTVIQWDKDDIDSLGIFKVDLLGLGMLNVIARAFALLVRHRGIELDLGGIPPDDRATYEMIQRADTVGVFQIESRAQMGMLPRLKPRCFYDLVIEVALVRPGPIQGGMVHPYLRRRRGEEQVDYPHPKLRPILERTLGVPIFQEQVMRMAVEVGGYTPGEADQLRRDMAAWRRSGRMKQHQERLYAAMRQSGIDEEFAARIVRQIEGFGSYGFPESHAAAFAHLVYVSSYLKCHYPAEFAVALINAQPMGFYQVATIVADAHRHHVAIEPVCVNHSQWEAQVEPRGNGAPASTDGGRPSPGALRLGFRSVRGFPEDAAERIVAERRAHGPFRSVDDLARRCLLARKQLTQLALAGAFSALADRRSAIWRASALGVRSFAGGNDLVANAIDESPVAFPALSAMDEMWLDHSHADSFLERHPMQLYRPKLRERGVLRSVDLRRARPNSTVQVAGLVLVRQRPTGPGGVVFMALEDETGLVDIVLRPETFTHNRTLIALAEVLLIQGRLQADGDARSVLAQSLHNLQPHRSFGVRSRDFH